MRSDAGIKGFKRYDGDILDHAAAPLLLGSIGTFLLLTHDLFGSSWHTIGALDLKIHDWVMGTLSVDTQEVMADYVSDTFIVPELVLWPVLCFVILKNEIGGGALVVALSAITYALGGVFLHGDALLVDCLKANFHRIRPSLNHRTFSYPSGHTCAAVVLTGTIIFVLLPIVLEKFSADSQVEDDSGHKTGSNNVMQVIRETVQNTGPYIWASSYLVTAAGRVGGNAHWFSDTLGGLLVGVGLVSSLKILVNYGRNGKSM